ncbi:nucleoside-diphosphate kinase [Streptomyces acidiscabies]|uniref:nucleoside-diphosphate kinase n=1 Tax=Streptomyces acidiscabies TaxID=42234 RepID=UPI00073E4E20|nr:nucleoside-diphosphate kinase [Streptomyces acidiscabies]GAQ58043.1 nucleoside diphosphate kinase [Streptomyces acidiscabies]
MSRKPPGGAVVDGIDFDRWAVVLCKPDAVERGLVERVLARITEAGFTVVGRRETVVQPWQAHVTYRGLLTGPRNPGADVPALLDQAFTGRPVAVALAHGTPEIHSRLRQLIGHTDPAAAAAGTIRSDLGTDSLEAAALQKRLVRNLVHTSDDPAAARREFGVWFAEREVPDFAECSVILCKPDAVERGLVAEVLDRVRAAGFTVSDPVDVTVRPWQIHVHYWDLLVDADWFPDRDIPACLDAEYADRHVSVALAHAEPGCHGRLRQLLGHFDPMYAAPGTIRGDLGADSLEIASLQKRLVRNLVHTSDDADAARRDFGTWFGAGRRALLTSLSVPAQPTSADH